MTTLFFLLIEFLDELVFGVTDAAWPLIRADLHLNYIQIGLALSVPGIVGNLVEPLIGILGDVWKRRVLILGGGIFFSLACLLTAISHNFIFLLASFILFNPASGAFVSLSQASMMDKDPARHEHNMARWTLAGSIGVVLGPLLLGGAALIGFGWRGLFFALAGIAGLLLLGAWRYLPSARQDHPPVPEVRAILDGLRGAWAALRRGTVLRWLFLLEFADLMQDVLYGYLALYFVDAVGFSASKAAVGVAIWTGFGLLGDLLIIPLLERVKGPGLCKGDLGGGTTPFSGIFTGPQPVGKTGHRGFAGTVPFRLVSHLAGEPLLIHAGAKRDGHGGARRGGTDRPADPLRDRAGGGGVWVGGGHVVPAGRTGGALNRPSEER